MLDRLIGWLAPPSENASPRKVFYWRLTVSGFMISLGLFILFAFGGIWRLDGFALASDIDSKIAMAIKPVSDRLTMIEGESKTQSGYLKRLVQSDLERLINRELRARCQAATSGERQRIKDAIDSYQRDYKEVFGVKYEEPACGEL